MHHREPVRIRSDRTAFGGLFIALLMSTATQAIAQQSEAAAQTEDTANQAIGDIIVTAQKRSENLQNVGAAISAVAGEDLTKRNINSILDVSGLAPNVTVGTNFGMAYIYIRGVGFDNVFNGAEASVAMHIDGAYIGKGEGQLGEFLDLERVEILRGPQGTLYGRNSTGGSVNLISRRPTETPHAYGRLTYGNYRNIVAEGAVSGPLAGEAVLGRIAFKINHREGFGKNVLTGSDIDNASSQSVRASLLFNASGGPSLFISGSYYRAYDKAYAPHFVAPAYPGEVAPSPFANRGVPTENPRDIASPTDPRNNREVWSLTGIFDADLNDALKLKYIANYRDISNKPIVDAGVGFPVYVAQRLDYQSYSQELQVNISTDIVDGAAGLYYFHHKEFGDLRVCTYFLNAACEDPYRVPDDPSQALLQQRGTVKVNTFAGYANLNIHATDTFTIVTGARYSYEKRKGVSDRITFPTATIPNFADTRSFTNFSPRLGLEYRPADQMMLFATFSKGFKAGIFQTGSFTPVLKPETVSAYEVGIKSRLFDKTLQINASAFWYDFQNLQVSRVIPDPRPGGTSVTVFENAATTRNKGFEVETVWAPLPGLRFDGSVGYLEAKYRRYLTTDPLKANVRPLVLEDAGGNALPLSPKWSGSLRASYSTDLSDGLNLEISGAAKYKSRIFFTAFNNDRISQEAATVFDANVLLKSQQGWSVNLWAKNIGDDLIKAIEYVGGGARALTAQYQEPRTYGVTLGFDF